MRRIEPVTCENLSELSLPCDESCYWEKSCSGSYLPPCSGLSLCPGASEHIPVPDKTFGRRLDVVGRLLFEDDSVIGYAQMGPSRMFPRVWSLPAGPPRIDSYLLSCLYISKEARGRGNGKYLLRYMLKELNKSQAANSLEAFPSRHDKNGLCKFYTSQGFRIIRDSPRFPLLRLEMKSLLGWQESMSSILEQLKKPLRVPAQPVPW